MIARLLTTLANLYPHIGFSGQGGLERENFSEYVSQKSAGAIARPSDNGAYGGLQFSVDGFQQLPLLFPIRMCAAAFWLRYTVAPKLRAPNG